MMIAIIAATSILFSYSELQLIINGSIRSAGITKSTACTFLLLVESI